MARHLKSYAYAVYSRNGNGWYGYYTSESQKHVNEDPDTTKHDVKNVNSNDKDIKPNTGSKDGNPGNDNTSKEQIKPENE
jgi:hypothetical protein